MGEAIGNRNNLLRSFWRKSNAGNFARIGDIAQCFTPNGAERIPHIAVYLPDYKALLDNSQQNIGQRRFPNAALSKQDRVVALLRNSTDNSIELIDSAGE